MDPARKKRVIIVGGRKDVIGEVVSERG